MTNDRQELTGCKPKHTPGPFHCQRNSDGVDDTFDIYAECRSFPLVSIHFWDEPDSTWAPEAEGNAYLFAAAPELLAALRLADMALSLLARQAYAGSSLASLIEAAVKKAEGGGARMNVPDAVLTAGRRDSSYQEV